MNHYLRLVETFVKLEIRCAKVWTGHVGTAERVI